MRHGISRRELSSMAEAEFRKTLAYLRGDGRHIDDSNPFARVTSQYQYVSPKVPQSPATDDKDDATQTVIMNSLNDQLLNDTTSYSYVFCEPRRPGR
jgi:hypothetical protein